MRLAIVILAAGQGTRMKSKRPKVLHPVAGEPMAKYVLEAVTPLQPDRLVLVVGEGATQIRQALGEDLLYVEQPQQLGTGHALLQTREVLENEADTLLVLHGDTPLVTSALLRRLLKRHQQAQATITMLTCRPKDPTGYGRVLRDAAGRVLGVVEEATATAAQKGIQEVTSGMYCFDASWLWPHLGRIERNEKGGYYLTDLVAMAIAEGKRVEVVDVGDATEVMGINHRAQLAEAEAAMRARIRQEWMLAGVTLMDPPSTWIDRGVQLSPDVTIYPNTFLQGRTMIGCDCVIGPNTIVRDSVIGERCRILASVIEEATLEDDVDVGPFSHLRPGAHLARGVHVGNFVEIKKSYVGEGSKIGHFSYLGDATVGREVNIGAGTVTCNYDGVRKHPTVIEDGAFIGSDTMLVAPVRVGAGARIGAGAVVTRDIPPHSLAYGVPARVRRKESRTEDE
ncbi:MAG TPA: UDP-N-acetylglucosamine diphosphorylase/glucosamine-1-phosphate N-acetyltransferase [Anaerolineae bacterium]|nr:UDP-N-acetylglucosamine diphosphorylase/glucosamine-1-phosphate N-acetyltransferase [Anaerolineae bacterium]